MKGLVGIFCLILTAGATFGQQQRANPAAQREAMKKLSFLVGTWKGEATMTRAGQPLKIAQTEQVAYKLDGLVLVVEGTGRKPESDEIVFRAFATVSFDDAAGVYRFRSYNDGNYLDTELKVPEKGFEWGYKAGPAQIAFVMKLNDKGEWVERGETTMGGNPPQRFLDMTVRKQE